MATFLALLRGVNVGNAKRVPMAEFRALLEGHRYTNVVTLLNSGNAIFRSTRGRASTHAADIARAIERRLSIEVPVVVTSATDLVAIVHENPFGASAPDPSRLLVAFAPSRESLARLHALEALVTRVEQVHVGEHAAYLHCPDGILQSKAGEALLGGLGRAVTTRNWSTVLKLHALAASTPTDTPEPKTRRRRA